MDGSDVSIAELQASQQEYEAQLAAIATVLATDPTNGELLQTQQELQELLAMTKELLAEAQQVAPVLQAVVQEAQQMPQSSGTAQGGPHMPGMGGPSDPGGGPNLTLLPQSVREQIRKAQVVAALAGKGPLSWAVGARVDAVYPGDGKTYPGVVQDVGSEADKLVVAYDGYQETAEVDRTQMEPKEEEEQAYKGVQAPLRTVHGEGPIITELPAWLTIKDTDNAKEKEKKKLLIRRYKKRINLQKKQQQQQKQADDWRKFQKTKGAKRKAGFLTTTKRDSMFKGPESVKGKVGVVGSGKGMTDFNKRQRHAFGQDDL